MGLKMTCTRWHKRSNGMVRCAKFEKAKKVGRHPECPSDGLKGGGRSQWAIRANKKRPCKRTGERSAGPRRAKRVKRTKRSRRSRK